MHGSAGGQSKTSVDLGQSNSTAPEILDCPGGFQKSQMTRTKEAACLGAVKNDWAIEFDCPGDS
jgi:hypothetical protein